MAMKFHIARVIKYSSRNGLLNLHIPNKKESSSKTYPKHGSHIWVDHSRTFSHSPNSDLSSSNLTNTQHGKLNKIMESHHISEVVGLFFKLVV